MKRKFLLFLTMICLVFSTVVQPLPVASAQTSYSTLNVGDAVHGFDLTKVGYDSSTKSTEYLFVHKKTGAKLLILKNSDKNRGFSIKFNTNADNNKGINHIIEHMIVAGGKKYGGKNLLFDLTNTTYSSFVNAFTYQNMTLFPVCSASEEQLLKSTDIYLDAVFNPLFLSDERLFEREGWRYELPDQSADLSYNGIVYNEMKGNAGNKELAALRNAQKAIFKGTNQSYNSGGDPNAIPTLTYDEVVNTYEKNYQPSNSLMVLYGDVDYEAFLKLIDENYLSSYTKGNTTIDRGTQKPFQKLLQKTYTFPVDANVSTENQSVIDLVFAADDVKKLGFENFVSLNIAVSLLNLDSSDLKKALMSSNIAESYSISMGTDTYQPTVHFIATNADPAKKLEFSKLIMTELKKIVDKGLDTEVVNSALRSMDFQKALGNDSSTAVNSIVNISLFDNLTGDPMLNYNDCYKNIVTKLKDKVLEKVLQKQILDSKTAALAVTVPQKGLLEKNNKAAAKALAKEKAALSKKQLKALVKKTSDFNIWNSQGTSADVLKSYQGVALKDLSTEVRDRNIKETTIDGAKLMTADADVDSVSSICMTFDLSHLTPEELLYLKFYGDMLGGGMATTNRTESQVLNDVVRKANNVSASVTAFMDDKNDTSAHPVFAVNYYGFENEYADTFDLVSDMLLQSKLSDISTYGSRTIANIKAQYQGMFADPLSLALIRSLAYTSPSYQYSNYFNGLDYYNFVLSLEQQIAANPSAVADKISAIRAKAFNKSNLTILFAGDSSAQELYKASMTKFTQKLPNETYKKADYTLPKPAKREALTINSTVQYVSVNGSLSANNIAPSGKSSVITYILNNLMLTPEIRLKGGAYGVGSSIQGNNYYVYTYRDANYVNSLTTIGSTDEFLKAVSPYLTEDTLESYKLSAYATATQSSGEINDALVALINNCQGITRQDEINSLNELKSTSLADIPAYADYLEKINNNINYVVVAPASSVEANKSLFDSIIPLP